MIFLHCSLEALFDLGEMCKRSCVSGIDFHRMNKLGLRCNMLVQMSNYNCQNRLSSESALVCVRTGPGVSARNSYVHCTIE
jgi:hypothetical protein